jgi:hypothetical protein
MLAFAYIENEGNGQILLTKDKNLTVRNEKHIFSIDVMKLRESSPTGRDTSKSLVKRRNEVKPIDDYLNILWTLSTKTNDFSDFF